MPDVDTPAIITIASKEVVTSTLPVCATKFWDALLGRGPRATANGTRENVVESLRVLKQRLHNLITDCAIEAKIRAHNGSVIKRHPRSNPTVTTTMLSTVTGKADIFGHLFPRHLSSGFLCHGD